MLGDPIAFYRMALWTGNRPEPARIARIKVAGTILCLCLSWTGCGESKRPSPPPSNTTNTTITTANALQGSNDAARAWAELVPALDAPPTPAAWEGREPTQAELAQYQSGLGAAALATAARVRAFQNQFPGSPEASASFYHEWELLDVAAQTGHTQAMERLRSIESSLLANTALPRDRRIQIRLRQMQRGMQDVTEHSEAAQIARMETELQKLETEFPDALEPKLLRLSLVERWMDAGEWDRARSLLTALPALKTAEEQGAVRRRNACQRRVDLHGKEPKLEAQLADGTPFKLEAWKGRVVIVHFWAASSPVSLRDLPRLDTLYQRLKALGVEMISVSVDPDRKMWENRLFEKPMGWAQVYDGPSGNWVEQCGILTVPSLWLVDRKGRFRSFHNHVEVAGAAAALVAEP